MLFTLSQTGLPDTALRIRTPEDADIDDTKQKIGITVNFMGTGIMVYGLNGAGKSTLGRALAEKLNFYFIDHEDLFFPKTDPDYIYVSPCTREEVEKYSFMK